MTQWRNSYTTRQQRDQQIRQMPMADTGYRVDTRALIGWAVMGLVIAAILLAT